MSQQQLKDKYSYNFPLKPSTPDDRDFVFGYAENLPDSCKKFGSVIQQQLPETYDLRPKLTPVRDQGEQNSCFSFAVSVLKAYQELMNCGFQGDMSPQFFYNNRPDDADDNGMEDRDVMKLLLNVGICSEQDLPYGSITHKKDIPQKCYINAKNYRCKSFATIKTIDDVKLALIQNGPVICGLPVYNYSNTYWKPADNSEQMQGGHANTLVFFNQKGFGIRNSWGQSWGDNGYSLVPYEDFNSFIGLWTAVDDLSSVNVYVPNKDKPIEVIEQQKEENKIRKDVTLTSSIYDVHLQNNQVFHVIWIKLINISKQDVQGVKLKIDCDNPKLLKGLQLTNNKVIFQMKDGDTIRPKQEFTCLLQTTGKKPVVQLM